MLSAIAFSIRCAFHDLLLVFGPLVDASGKSPNALLELELALRVLCDVSGSKNAAPSSLLVFKTGGMALRIGNRRSSPR